MFATFAEIREALTQYRWFQDTVDIALVYYLFYRLLLIIKGTRAFQMLLGMGLLVLALIASQALEFYTLDWVIHSFWSQIVIAGSSCSSPRSAGPLRRWVSAASSGPFARRELKVHRRDRKGLGLHGEQADRRPHRARAETDLTTIVEMGTNLDAKVSKEILISIFLPYSPIHDGATIVRNGRIIAAGCFLPLTLSTTFPRPRDPPSRAVASPRRRTPRSVLGVRGERARSSAVMNGKIEPSLDAPGSASLSRTSSCGRNRSGDISGHFEDLFRELAHQARLPGTRGDPLVLCHLQGEDRDVAYRAAGAPERPAGDGRDRPMYRGRSRCVSRGRSGRFRDIAADKKVVGTLDLSRGKEGENIIHLSPNDISKPSDVLVTHLNPFEITVTLDHLVRKSFRLKPVLIGRPAPGLRVATVAVAPRGSPWRARRA